VSRGVSPSSELEQSKNEDEDEDEDVLSISADPTPRPKRTASKTQFIDDGISELTSTDDPKYEVSAGDTNESELDKLDTSDTDTGAGAHDSDPGEGPRQQKKAGLSKSSGTKDNHEGKEKGKLRDAIFQGRSRKHPVRH
jgi:hypothetical protein